MGIGDIARRVVVEYDGDESNLVKALEEIDAGTRAMAEQFGAASAHATRALDTIGLGAENQLSRLQRLNNAFQGMTGKLGQGLKAVNEFGKALAPWHQALGLAGKALDTVDAGLEAYSKTSKKAAEEVATLRKEFGGLKESAMAALGAITVEALKPLPSLKKMREELEGIEGVFLRAFQNAPNAMANRAVTGMFSGDTFRGMFAADPWATSGFSLDDALDKVAAAKKKYEDAAKKAREEAQRLRAEQAARQYMRDNFVAGARNEARTSGFAEVGDVLVATQRPVSFELGAAASTTQTDDFGRIIDEGQLIRLARAKELTDGWFAEIDKRQGQQSVLESMFGSVDEISGYVTAFGAVNTAVQSSMQAWISGSMSLGTAIKKGLGDALAGVASQMAVESLKHAAFGLGSLAFGDVPGAARHGAAAAAFGAGAVAAAAAAKKLGSSVNADLAKRDAAGGGASAGAPSSSGPSSNSGGGQQQVIIVYGDSFAHDSPRARQVQAEQLVKTALGSSAVEHS